MTLYRLIGVSALASVAFACGSSTGPVPVASIAVSPSSLTLEVGQQHTMAAYPLAANGDTLGGRSLKWSSSDPSIAKVIDISGLVTAVAPGKTTLTATVEGVSKNVAVTVTPPSVASVTVTPQDSTIWAGGTIRFIAAALDAESAVLPDKVITWNSSQPSIVSVNDTGLATAIKPGTATITASADTASVSVHVIVRASATYATISAGGDVTCGITTTGVAYCWGRGDFGQLGFGGAEDVEVPIQVSGNHTWLDIAPSTQFTCGTSSADAAYCWGTNTDHRLGNDTSITGSCSGVPCATVPGPVVGGHAFAAVETGTAHACALDTSGAAYCWGNGGELGYSGLTGVTCGAGLGSHPCTETPLPVDSGFQYTSLTARNYHTCAITTGDATYCWGSTPTTVPGGLSFSMVSAGGNHTCGVTATGVGYCWGSNSSGQLGTGGSTTSSPAAVTGGLTFSMIVAGGNHSCGLTTDGHAYCWGANASGQLGIGTEHDVGTPEAVHGGYLFTALAAGDQHTCGKATDGRVYCWGSNAHGQLGISSLATSTVPVRVVGQN